MVRSNRHRLDIIADILGAAVKNGKKTRIMYHANLSHALLQKYLGEAVDLGFVSLASAGYRLTERGEDFLGMYNSFSSRYKNADRILQSLAAERSNLEKMCHNGNGRNCVTPKDVNKA